MISEEVICTIGRIVIQMMILYVLFTCNSLEAFVYSVTGTFLGVKVPLCYGLNLYTIFFKVYEIFGSFNVAFFR